MTGGISIPSVLSHNLLIRDIAGYCMGVLMRTTGIGMILFCILIFSVVAGETIPKVPEELKPEPPKDFEGVITHILDQIAPGSKFFLDLSSALWGAERWEEEGNRYAERRRVEEPGTKSSELIELQIDAFERAARMYEERSQGKSEGKYDKKISRSIVGMADATNDNDLKLEYLNAALDWDPLNTQAWNEKIKVLEQQGKKEEAKRAREELILAQQKPDAEADNNNPATTKFNNETNAKTNHIAISH